MMTALYILGYIVGYLAVGTALLWGIARVGGLNRKEDPLVLVAMVVGWPLTAFIAAIIGFVFKSGELLNFITDRAYSAREQAEKKEEQLLKLQEEKEKELQEAIRCLDRELEEVEEKRKAQKFWSPARVNVLESVDHA
jgi:uncharacterized protein YlxW (UPF0749 family)